MREVELQERLYIPGLLLHKGKNEIIIFKTNRKVQDYVELVDEAKLGQI